MSTFADRISQSILSDPDKHLWQEALVFLSDRQQQLLEEFVRDSVDCVERLRFLTNNLKAKINAVQFNDRDLFQQILATERQDLTTL